MWLARGKPSNAVPRRAQKFTGTHREARGKIMAVLRASGTPTPREGLEQRSGLTPTRFATALTSLVDDGLARESSEGFSLPE